MPGSQKFSYNCHWKALLNFLRVLDCFLEISSESENSVGLLSDEKAELGHTINSCPLDTWKISAQPGSSEIFTNSGRKSYSNLLRISDVCLEMPSDSKNYFGFEVNESSELVHTIKSLGSRHWNMRYQTAGHGPNFTKCPAVSQRYAPQTTICRWRSAIKWYRLKSFIDLVLIINGLFMLCPDWQNHSRFKGDLNFVTQWQFPVERDACSWRDVCSTWCACLKIRKHCYKDKEKDKDSKWLV